jgi:hypothetical protein
MPPGTRIVYARAMTRAKAIFGRRQPTKTAGIGQRVATIGRKLSDDRSALRE